MLHKERDVFKAVHASYIYSSYCAFIEVLSWRPSVLVSPLISCHKWSWGVFCFHPFDLFVWVCCMPCSQGLNSVILNISAGNR